MTHRYSERSPIRIDTMRQQIAHTLRMLEAAAQEIETLHALAYERPTATSSERITGAAPDWALDTHGDHTARSALQALQAHLSKACVTITSGAEAAVAAVNDRTPGHVDHTRHRTRITVTEFLAVIDAAERRRERGEYTPHRIAPQPVLSGTEATLRAQLKAARKENTRLRRDVQRLASG